MAVQPYSIGIRDGNGYKGGTMLFDAKVEICDVCGIPTHEDDGLILGGSFTCDWCIAEEDKKPIEIREF